MEHVDVIGPNGCKEGALMIILGEHITALDEAVGIRFSNKSNFMWNGLSEAFGEEIGGSRIERETFLRNHRIMIVDLYGSWEDDGSVNSCAIRNPKCIDMKSMCAVNPNARVLCFSKAVLNKFCSEFPNLSSRAMYMHTTSSTWIRQKPERKKVVVDEMKNEIQIMRENLWDSL